ncbi:MAG: type II toxin-antitoxin system VapC family toxin [Acidobacteria bacterium]|nr:type II toxin-antitoxin system VapC family toxin [Acidobacteriota bacterium]MYD72399.1 type II toxin-antitoxin system VapC family toxin [Acidobacteriota bacterium]MYJ04463.1 type II toxin-antitoxin system VapC family toxin [Acidobacteriota bacterium]
MFLLDTNVLLDIFTDDPQWRAWSENALAEALVAGPIGINPIIYAEASLAFDVAETLDRQLDELMIERLPLPYNAAFGAARAFRRYRDAGGARSAPLPDFYIGAHAEADGLTLVTRDSRRFQTYFPVVPMVSPPTSA